MMNNIIIFSPRIARDLIQKGFRVVDIKPDKNIRIKTIFFFENIKELKEYLSEKHDIKIK